MAIVVAGRPAGHEDAPAGGWPAEAGLPAALEPGCAQPGAAWARILTLGPTGLIAQARTAHPACEDNAKAALRNQGCHVELRELWTGRRGSGWGGTWHPHNKRLRGVGGISKERKSSWHPCLKLLPPNPTPPDPPCKAIETSDYYSKRTHDVLCICRVMILSVSFFFLIAASIMYV